MANIFHKLKNKTAVVTGAGSGIGRAISDSLVSHGCNLIAIGRSEKNLDALKNDHKCLTI